MLNRLSVSSFIGLISLTGLHTSNPWQFLGLELIHIGHVLITEYLEQVFKANINVIGSTAAGGGIAPSRSWACCSTMG